MKIATFITIFIILFSCQLDGEKGKDQDSSGVGITNGKDSSDEATFGSQYDPESNNIDNITRDKPILLFSDMVAAPSKGWSYENPDRGAAVSVWGLNLGATRDNSYISVGGVPLDDSSDYVVWNEPWPTPYWGKITFFLNSSITQGDRPITVTVNGVKSNPLDFSVIQGNIYFVDDIDTMGNGTINNPYGHISALDSKFKNCSPGDVFYYREGLYDNPVGAYGQAILAIRGTDNGYVWGTESRPISVIGYPGERPVIQLLDPRVGLRSGMSISANYYTIAGFTFDTGHCSIGAGSYVRVIGNDIVGMKGLYFAGSASVITSGSGARIYGNAIHGGRSHWRLDHAIYLSGAPVEDGSYIGWNYIFDNDFGRGPEIAVNHQDNRVPSNEYVKSHYIFNNIVDTNPQRATIINIYDLSWDEGEANQPEPIYIYNNLFFNAGHLDTVDTYNNGWAAAMVVSRDHSRFYNNIFYNSSYMGIQIGNGVSGAFSCNIQNNVFHFNSDIDNIPSDRQDRYYTSISASEDLYTLKDNYFYSTGSRSYKYQYGGKRPLNTRTNTVNSDVGFTDPENMDFSLSSSLGYWEIKLDGLLPDKAPEAISVFRDFK